MHCSGCRRGHLRVCDCLQPLQVRMLPLVLLHCCHQVQKAKLGPQYVGEHQQRVPALPQQKIGQPCLAARAHQQVYGRAVAGVQRAV